MAAAAAAAAAMDPLPTSSPPAHRIVAPRVSNRVAAAAVICLFQVASLWLLFGSLTTMEIGQLACGQGCPVVVVASKVLVAAVTLAVVFTFSVLPLMRRARPADAATDIEAAKAPAPKPFAVAAREALRDPFMQAFLASMMFALLMTVGALLKVYSPVKGSRQERMGSVIYEVGALGFCTVNFFVVCPILTVTMWRAWRRILRT